MTSGWIICLAVVCQTSAWGTPSNGWQAAPNNAAQQMRYGTNVQQPAQPGTNQHVTAPQFASQQQQPASQFAQQQPQQQMVDQYGRPLTAAQGTAVQGNAVQQQQGQQFGQQPAQHPWQNNGSQFTGNQQAPAQQNQASNWGQPNYDPRIAANNLSANSQNANNQPGSNQNISLAPSGVAAQNNFQQQPNSNWQQYNTQQQANQLQLTPPQQNTTAQSQWPTQSQTTYDPRSNQSTHLGQQYGGSGNSSWGQPAGRPTGGSQFATQNSQTGSQFNNSLRNPQFDANVNAGGSQFGAQINLGDNRFRVADNTHSVLPGSNQHTNQVGQTSGQHQQPSLALQPPLQGTLPAGSNPSGEHSQQNVNPHVLVQPPRVGDNNSQGTVAVDDNRWTNLQQPTDATQVASRPTSSDLQPIPAGQPSSDGQTQLPANNGQTAGNTNPNIANQHVPQIATAPQVNAPAGSLFGSLANRNTNSQPTAFGQNSQATGLPKDGLFAAASRNAQSQGNTLNQPPGSEDGYTPSPFAFGVSLVFNFLMVGGVMYLGWIAFESHFRYRRALLDGDDIDDRRSSRDDDRSSRRR